MDELLITAGYRYRCASAVLVPTDGRRCDQCGHTDETCTCTLANSFAKGDAPQ